MKKNSPLLANSVKEFLNGTLKSNTGQKYKWIDKIRLPTVSHEFYQEVGPDCRVEQVAIRTNNKKHIEFRYDPINLHLLMQHPLQKSFFFIHEWLWNHLTNEKQISKVNWFLHSKKARLMSNNEFNKALREMGLI